MPALKTGGSRIIECKLKSKDNSVAMEITHMSQLPSQSCPLFCRVKPSYSNHFQNEKC